MLLEPIYSKISSNQSNTKELIKLIPYFSEDCEIEIFGLKLKGKSNMKK